MTKYLAVMMIALLTSMGLAIANDSISYSFVEANYVNTSTEDGPDAQGVEVGLSAELGNYLFVFANYSEMDLDKIGGVDSDTDFIAGGGGAHFDLGKRLSLFGTGSVGKVNIITSNGLGLDDTVYTYSGGVRVALTKRLEAQAGASRVDFENIDAMTVYDGALRFGVFKSLQLQAGYSRDGDSNDNVSGGLRYVFN